MIRVCFVCLGNICRSPTAEGVMRQLVQQANLSEQIAVEGAGTAASHAGEPPDARAAAAAARRGIPLGGVARRFVAEDWKRLHYVLAVDASTLSALRRSFPQGASARLELLRHFDSQSPAHATDVPDPYYGGPAGFEEVLDLCQAACRGLLDHLRAQHPELVDSAAPGRDASP